MKNFKSHFKFNKQERSGIFFLLFILILLQGISFFLNINSSNTKIPSFSLNQEEQVKIDSLKKAFLTKETFEIYPFNPNFITDYKGYTLGLIPEEIDRLQHFRDQDKYVNSAKEFQAVTKVSDSLLNRISPYFKFPDWVNNSAKKNKVITTKKPERRLINPSKAIIKKDLNLAGAQDLKAIYGIGDKLSARIIKFRDRLGGFLINEQLYDVYGLEAEVADRALKKFEVLNPPKIDKININNATASEIAKLVYIPYQLANNIVVFRNQRGRIDSFEELREVDGFPVEKLDRIALYLSL